MAAWAALSDLTLSTSTTGWNRIEAMDWQPILANNREGTEVMDIGDGPYTRDVTFANAGDQVGIILPFGRDSIDNVATITVKLQENSGGWVDRTTDTLAVNDTNFPLEAHLLYIPLTSYTVTTAGSTWRYEVSIDNADDMYIYNNGTPGQFSYAAILNNTGKPSAGDMVAIANDVTVTMDENFSCAADANSGVTSMLLCRGAVFYAPNAGTPLTWTLDDEICIQQHGGIRIGDSGDRWTAANPFTLAYQHTANVPIFVSQGGGAYDFANINEAAHECFFEMWGETSTDWLTRIDDESHIASGLSSFTTEDDMSALWSNGDTIQIIGADASGTADTATYTIDSVSGTTVTLTGTTSYLYFDKSMVVNLTVGATAMGILLTRAGTAQLRLLGDVIWEHLNMEGIYGTHGRFQTGASRLQVTKALGINSTFKSILINDTGTSNQKHFDITNRKAGTVVSDVVLGGTGGNNSGYFRAQLPGATITRIGAQNIAGTVLNSANAVVSKLAIHSNNAGNIGRNTFEVQSGAVGSTISDSLGTGGYSNFYINSGTGVTFNDVISAAASNTYIWLGNGNATLKDCNIGADSALSPSDGQIVAVDDTFHEILLNNCEFSSDPAPDESGAITGSYVRYHQFNLTANDHRTVGSHWNSYSTGSGLTYTTVHTAGGLGILFEHTGDDISVDWQFLVPTGDIQNKDMMVGVWCKINSANFYSGSHTMPRLNVNYDDGTTTYAEAAESIDWQFLSVPFTPATDFGQITLTINSSTDQSGTNSHVYFDDFSVLYPAGTTINLGNMDVWARGLPVTPPLAVTFNAVDVWNVSTSTLTGSGTIGKLLSKSLTIAKFLGLK